MKRERQKENAFTEKRRLIPCLAAFIITAVCAAAALLINKIEPFGNHSILLGDLNCEYLPFLTELWDKLHTGGSLAFSWRTGLGGNFIGNYLYYLASPLNLLILLFKRTQILGAIQALIFFRQSLAAAFMTWTLLKRKTGGAGAAAVCCGVCYAFCGWFAAYFTNIIWLDAFVLLPLLVYGIETLVDKGRPWLFGACFLWILFSDFYMAYIVGVFSVVYWLRHCFVCCGPEKTDKKSKPAKTPFLKSRLFRSGCLLAGTAVFCALLLGAALIPLFLLMSHNTENETMTSAVGFFKLFSAKLANSLSGTLALDAMRTTDYPHVYCGILALAAAPLYFCSKKISVREKLADAAVLIFFWLSFNISALDFLWHGFRYPNGFSFRQTFAYALFLLLPVFRALSSAADVPKKAWAASAGLSAILMLAGVVGRAQSGEGSGVTTKALLVSLALFALFTVVLLVLKNTEKRTLIPVCAIALLLLTGIDCTWNFSENLRFYQTDAAETRQNYTALREMTQKEEDASFGRAELSSACVLNDGAFFGFHGIRQSSSIVSSDTLRFLSGMGMDSNLSNIAGLYPQTPVFYSIFGVKTLYEENRWAGFSHTSLSNRADENILPAEETALFNSYTFGYALPPGF